MAKMNVKKALLSIGLCAMTVGAGVYSAFSPLQKYTAFADNNAVVVADYDATEINNDLSDMSLAEYPKDETGTPQVIRFQEYCYTEDTYYQEVYDLYVYVYNPTEKEIRQTGNVINAASWYKSDGTPGGYANTALTLVDYTENWRFLKFKISDSGSFFTRAKSYAQAHNGQRRYDLSGIQLKFKDGTSTQDASIAKTYRWSGYAEGLNGNAESTLRCEQDQLETLSLDVKHTYYREETSQNVFKTDMVHSVYFSVPDEILETYGKLQKIHAEYLGALLKPILVMGEKEVYDAIYPYLWQDLSTHNEELDYQVAANVQKEDWLGFDHSAQYILNYNEDDWNYVLGGDDFWDTEEPFNQIYEIEPERMDRLYFMFQPGTNGGNSADEYRVSSEVIKSAMLSSAENSHSTGTVNGAEGLYSRDIFERIDAEKTTLNLSADDSFDLTQTVVKKDFWETIFNMSGSSETVQKVFTEVPVIQKVRDIDFANSVSVNCKNLLIAEEDYADFQNTYETAKRNGESLYLFRYRASEYESYEGIIFEDDWTGSPVECSTNSYFFSQEVDLDFDIIDVTFLDDAGTETVMGVVSSPLDFVADSTPPENPDGDNNFSDWWADLFGDNDGNDGDNNFSDWWADLFGDNDGNAGDEDAPWWKTMPWWGWLIIAVAVIAVCWLIKPFSELIAGLLKGVWWFICLPFRGIRWIFKKITGGNDE